MRLLFAEDDRDISKAVKTLLERSGYSVDVVFNGQDAIDYIESGEYDGVILDWMMPKRSGIEVLTQMRAKGFSEPVLILTARDSVDDRVKGLDTGADRYRARQIRYVRHLQRKKRSAQQQGFSADGNAR